MANREHRTKKPRWQLGDQTKLQDRNGNLLHIGDQISYRSEVGRLLVIDNRMMLLPAYSMWYGDDEFLVSSYGKCISIPEDNGGKLNLELLEPYN